MGLKMIEAHPRLIAPAAVARAGEGVRVTYFGEPGMIHGYFGMGAVRQPRTKHGCVPVVNSRRSWNKRKFGNFYEQRNLPI